MKNIKILATLTAYTFLAAFLTAVLFLALAGRFMTILAAVMFVALQSPTQVDTTGNTVTIEPIATVTPIAPILSLVPDIKAPIATMRKVALRQACRVAGIKYGKMTVPQMRQALTALSA